VSRLLCNYSNVTKHTGDIIFCPLVPLGGLMAFTTVPLNLYLAP